MESLYFDFDRVRLLTTTTAPTSEILSQLEYLKVFVGIRPLAYVVFQFKSEIVKDIEFVKPVLSGIISSIFEQIEIKTKKYQMAEELTKLVNEKYALISRQVDIHDEYFNSSYDSVGVSLLRELRHDNSLYTIFLETMVKTLKREREENGDTEEDENGETTEEIDEQLTVGEFCSNRNN